MREPRAMFSDIANDIADAEEALEASWSATANIDHAAIVMALRSIAGSQLSIAKLLFRQEADEIKMER